MTNHLERKRKLIGAGLVHPDDAICARAVALARREWSGKPLVIGDRRNVIRNDREKAAVERAIFESADDWVARWVEWGNAGAPSDRALVKDGIRRCYELSGIRWHGRVIWVESPLSGVLTHRLLPQLLADAEGPRLPTPWKRADRWPLPGGLLWTARESARDRENIPGFFSDDFRDRMDLELGDLAGYHLRSHAETLVEQPVRSQVALLPWFYHQIGPFRTQQHIGPTDPAELRQALARMGAQLPRRARARLHELLDAGDGDDIVTLNSFDRYRFCIGGQTLAGWLAKASLLQHACAAAAPPSLGDRLEAYRDANAAGPWWPSRNASIVAERPRVVHSEFVVATEAAQGFRRLHAADGPAVEWSDGTASFAVHGVLLPFDLVHDWSIERILAERNSEVRRIAIERIGWDRFVTEAQLTLVHGPVSDPGNPGNTLALYEVPPAYGTGVRLLMCTNASPERDGTIRQFGLNVPAAMDNAVTAAAWTFDVDHQTYEGLDRAT